MQLLIKEPLTSIEYMLVGDTTVHEEYFTSPVVRGALYKVELLKTDENDHPLTGAKFLLTTADNTPVFVTGSAGSYQFAPDGDNPLVESGTDGCINVTGLPDGSYLLTEIEPPMGYEIIGTAAASYHLSYTDNASALTADGSDFKLSSTPQVQNREKEKYTLSLHKQDDDEQPLANVHFTVYSGTKLLGELITDASGNASSPAEISFYRGITYSLHENVVPDGYYAPTDDLTFSVDEATGMLNCSTTDTVAWITCAYDNTNKVLSVTAVNTAGEKLPSTGGRGTAPFMITGLCLMALPIVYCGIFLYKRK